MQALLPGAICKEYPLWMQFGDFMSILMTVEELAKYLKIKPDTIYKKVRKGELPAIKLGKLVRFPKELIDEWIVEQATKTVKEFKAAKQKVEAKVEQTYKKVGDEVNHIVESAQHKAEEAVGEVKKTQENLTKSIKTLWKDLNTSFSVGGIATSGKKKKVSATAKKSKTNSKKVVKNTKSKVAAKSKSTKAKTARSTQTPEAAV